MQVKKSALIFKNINKLSSFLNDASKKVFVLITNFTKLGLLRVLQGVYGTSCLESYDHFLVFKLANFIENLEDVEYLFNSEGTETLIIECPNFTDDKYAALKGIEKIIKIVQMKENKKIIFIMKEEESEYFMGRFDKGVKDLFIKKLDEDFSARDLDEKSVNTILRQNVIFQGKKYHLGNFINHNEDSLLCISMEKLWKICFIAKKLK